MATTTNTYISEYKVGEIISIEDCGKCKNGGKSLRACKIRVGGTDNDNYDEQEDIVTVVTSATNVREGSRIAVAPAGSSFQDDEGSTREVTKASVGGVLSQGILCDSRMLGWSGGAKGVAVQIPESCAIGSIPPETKPRPQGVGEGGEAPPETKPRPGGEGGGGVAAPGLFEKKLTKAEKKKIAEEKRAARKNAKQAKSEVVAVEDS
eukprot:CAMPEP_0198275548 /NCGR_PEP_ID=MMETSP1447-20131203/64836_1 /TAXON_ID=420782 /ORGANISM="Chaetoceros dichaeta, Strain CCMP1751" /LENGTH=206 /DNA_ID=CAMNT_0043970429 /DNA_START=41 /DNA_END=660 /DNA_ORIENTATION=-